MRQASHSIRLIIAETSASVADFFVLNLKSQCNDLSQKILFFYVTLMLILCAAKQRLYVFEASIPAFLYSSVFVFDRRQTHNGRCRQP
jgi:hypothetical protein